MNYGELLVGSTFREELRRITESLEQTRRLQDQVAARKALFSRLEEETFKQAAERIAEHSDLVAAPLQRLRDDLIAREEAFKQAAERVAEHSDLMAAGLQRFRDDLFVRDLKADADLMMNMIATASSDYVRAVGKLSLHLDGYVESLREIDRRIKLNYFPPLNGLASWTAKEDLSLTLAAMRDGLLWPGTGLLAVRDRASLLSWAQPAHDFPEYAAAAWLLPPALEPSSESIATPISIVCEVRCVLCGSTLIVEGEERIQVSPRKLRIALDLIPLCATCIRQAEQDPEYWNESLDRLQGGEPPALRLIPGEGKDSTQPRGRGVLRLVKNEPDEDD